MNTLVAILAIIFLVVAIIFIVPGMIPGGNALSVCEKITDGEQKAVCTASVKGDSSICDSITGYKKDSCYQLVALKTKDRSICEKAPNKNDCLVFVAADYRDCEIVQGSIEKDYCYYYVGVKTKDASACNYVIDEELSGFCSIILKKDTSLCNGDGSCYTSVAMLSGDSSLCDKVQKMHKEVCLVLANRDKSLDCETYKQEQVCEVLAMLTKDSSICDRLDENKDSCYGRVAFMMASNLPIEWDIFGIMFQIFG